MPRWRDKKLSPPRHSHTAATSSIECPADISCHTPGSKKSSLSTPDTCWLGIVDACCRTRRRMQQTPRRKVAMLHQLWTRRHVVRVLSCTGATLLRPMLAWTQPQDTMAQPALQLLASCTAIQRRQAMYPFEAKERHDWHYVPRRRP